jgi:tight adherence protein C
MCKYNAQTRVMSRWGLPLLMASLLLLVSAGPTAAQSLAPQPGQPTPQPARPAGGLSPAQFVPPRPNQTPLPTPGSLTTTAQDDELIIDQIQVDKYPRVTARFTMRPLNGRPVPYLEPYDVMIMTNSVWQPVLEAHTVGRVPTTKTGTYEATWDSNLPTPAGSTVNGRFAVSINGRPEVEANFAFIVPFPRQAAAPSQAEPAPALIPVPHPDPGEVDQPLAQSMAAVLAGLAFLAGVGGFIGYTYWRRAQDRLAMWVGRSAEHRARQIARDSKSRRAMTLSPTTQFFGKWGAKLVSSAQGDKLRKSLVLAGRPTSQHYTRFVATKATVGFVLCMVGFWLMLPLAPFMTTILVSLTLGTVGFIVPSLWLGRAIKARQYNMKRELPDSLDLITIGVSAGLAFDGAVAEVVDKWDNDLSHEFSTMLGELRMGMGRRQALTNLTERTQVDEIQVMVSQLIQADELGMSLTDTLLTLADQMRLRRRQRAEELAHKAAVKMLIPLVFLIFPALFIVILGPAAQDMLAFVTNGP